MTVKINRFGWFDVFDNEGWHIGTWKTPKRARHKARMWHMYITTGEERYLHD